MNHYHDHSGDNITHYRPHSHGHRAFGWALLFTLGFAVVETIAGFAANSLALVSDAGHMLTDSLSLGLAAFAAWLSRRPPSASHSYGLARAEVVAALINRLLMLALVAFIVSEAWQRFSEPIQDYEKIRMLRTKLAGNPTPEAAAAAKRLDGFLTSISINTLPDKTAADVINRGKQIVHEIVNSGILIPVSRIDKDFLFPPGVGFFPFTASLNTVLRRG